jgi:hypothetical protein
MDQTHGAGHCGFSDRPLDLPPPTAENHDGDDNHDDNDDAGRRRFRVAAPARRRSGIETVEANGGRDGADRMGGVEADRQHHG